MEIVGNLGLNQWSEIFKKKVLTIEHEYDIAHKIDHFERVAKLAIELSLKEKANIKITIPAAWLHDCEPIKKNDPRNKFASILSANKAIQILQEIEYPSEFHENIAHAIAAHSFSGTIEPETIEAKVVQDADRLDALGSIGIARTLMLGATFNNPLYHLTEPFPKKRSIDDKSYIIDHFYRKLFPMAKTLKTNSGLAEAKQRLLIMEMFIEHLKKEINNKNFACEDQISERNSSCL